MTSFQLRHLTQPKRFPGGESGQMNEFIGRLPSRQEELMKKSWPFRGLTKCPPAEPRGKRCHLSPSGDLKSAHGPSPLVCGCHSPVDLVDLLDPNISQEGVGRRTGLQMRRKNVGLISGKALDHWRHKPPEGVLSNESFK